MKPIFKPTEGTPKPGSEWILNNHPEGKLIIVTVLELVNASTHFGTTDWRVRTKIKGFYHKWDIIPTLTPLDDFLANYRPNTPEAENLWMLQQPMGPDAPPDKPIHRRPIKKKTTI